MVSDTGPAAGARRPQTGVRHLFDVRGRRYNVRVRRALVLGVALLAIAAGVARGGGPASPLPLPCGLPQVQPLWVDFADGSVPFWSTIFARPGIGGAASNFIIPPQLPPEG